jgi:hypothetical protein
VVLAKEPNQTSSCELVHCVWLSMWHDNNEHIAGCVSQRPVLIGARSIRPVAC